MLVDAIVLAGGRSSRLDSVPKAELIHDTQTLLKSTVEAVPSARTVVVVGPVPQSGLPDRVRVTREDPPFGGPAAGIAAGASALAETGAAPSDYTIVLACDMPGVKTAVEKLVAALDTEGVDHDGVIAVDAGGRLQPLVAAYRTARLQDTLESLRAVGPLDGLSAFQLISGLRLTRVPVPQGATDDIDTWADAERLGVRRPLGTRERSTKEKRDMSKDERTRDANDEALLQWSARLVKALDIDGFEVDLASVLGLAGRAAHSVLRPAAPLTTFIVGYAAGLAVGSGKATSDDAVKAASDIGFQLCREQQASNSNHD